MDRNGSTSEYQLLLETKHVLTVKVSVDHVAVQSVLSF